MKEPEDIFRTKEFKELPLHKRIIMRIYIAIMHMLSC